MRNRTEKGMRLWRKAGYFLLCLLLWSLTTWDALNVQAGSLLYTDEDTASALVTGINARLAAESNAGENAENNIEEITEPSDLYAQSAVLLDADSGRILFAKNGQEERAMASTTKIMTCILALEYGKLDEVVTASAKAAAQPEVRLGVREGEQFYLRDLLYSLMLESHNDAAVVIAESVGTSVEGFADMMNQKAKELNCSQTYFITPNGLDAEDEKGIHHTTAADLARIMKYCVMDSPQKRMFREITGTADYQFTDCSGTRSFSCTNHNAFLHMMEGAFSGKTGFTGNAGYCYVGALENDGRTFIVALLACGWPNNKGYKWADTKKLMTYGIEHFHYQDISRTLTFSPVVVQNGVPDGEALSGTSTVRLVKSGTASAEDEEKQEIQMLLRDDEKIVVEAEAREQLEAPVEAGTYAGDVRYKLGDETVYSYRLVTESGVDVRDYKWCLENIISIFCMR